MKTFLEWLSENADEFVNDFASHHFHDTETLMSRVSPAQAAKARAAMDRGAPEAKVRDWLIQKSLDSRHGVPGGDLPPLRTTANMDRFSTKAKLPSEDPNQPLMGRDQAMTPTAPLSNRRAMNTSGGRKLYTVTPDELRGMARIRQVGQG